MEDDVGIGSETLYDFEVRMTANDSFVDAEFGSERLGLVGTTNKNGNIKLAAFGVLEKPGEDRATDVALIEAFHYQSLQLA